MFWVKFVLRRKFDYMHFEIVGKVISRGCVCVKLVF